MKRMPHRKHGKRTTPGFPSSLWHDQVQSSRMPVHQPGLRHPSSPWRFPPAAAAAATVNRKNQGESQSMIGSTILAKEHGETPKDILGYPCRA